MNLDHEGMEIKDDLEKVLLSRKTNPAEAVLVDGLSSKEKKTEQATASTSKSEEQPKLPKRIISKSGVEYIYIPLKGPLPVDDNEDRQPTRSKSERSSSHQPQKTRRKPDAAKEVGQKRPSQSAPSTNQLQPHHFHHNQEPKYIRIKLKPDHCYDDNDDDGASTTIATKPVSLNLPLQQENGTTSSIHLSDNNFNSIQKHARSLTNSPKLLRKDMGGNSPSQSVIRRNSFATLFRTGELCFIISIIFILQTGTHFKN